jgi:hypothetical protein
LGVWLIGDSPPLCRDGHPAARDGDVRSRLAGQGQATKLLAVLGVLALVLTVVALVTGSLTLLLLVANIVVLWSVSTLRHFHRGQGSRCPRSSLRHRLWSRRRRISTSPKPAHRRPRWFAVACAQWLLLIQTKEGSEWPS